MMQIHTAAYVLPIATEPIRQGAVAIDTDRIAAVGSLADLEVEFPDAEVSDHGDAAILPGFVNCHSHLEITAMRGALDDVEHDFRKWLLKLNDLRLRLGDENIQIGAIAGAVEELVPALVLLEHGVAHQPGQERRAVVAAAHRRDLVGR